MEKIKISSKMSKSTKKQIAKKYMEHLENGAIKKVIELFTENGLVDSPLYGIQKADAFYKKLNNDTTNSELHLLNIFEDENTNSVALYFTYKWTMINNSKVAFDVVDIIDFDQNLKIKKLKIIYDTVTARKLLEGLKK